jgi:hypothetical protein
MARGDYPAAVRKWEIGATLLQQQDGALDRYVLGFGQFVPPGLEFVRDLDVPRHNHIITHS